MPDEGAKRFRTAQVALVAQNQAPWGRVRPRLGEVVPILDRPTKARARIDAILLRFRLFPITEVATCAIPSHVGGQICGGIKILIAIPAEIFYPDFRSYGNYMKLDFRICSKWLAGVLVSALMPSLGTAADVVPSKGATVEYSQCPGLPGESRQVSLWCRRQSRSAQCPVDDAATQLEFVRPKYLGGSSAL